MMAGEKGIGILLEPSGLPGGTMSGATVIMNVSRTIGSPATAYGMNVSTDGATASYITLGTEFRYPGLYQIQFIVEYSPTFVLKSTIQSLEVLASLS